MSYWGWRRILAVFVSVLVVGCNLTQNAAPTTFPTQLPQSTLLSYAPLRATPPPPILLPLATALPSATPVTYTVQSGDTLTGIAYRFGVSLDSLIAVNPDLEPLTLPIGQSLFIPNPLFNPAGQPILPSSTPTALSLPTPTCYPSRTSSIICLGLVINSTMGPIERVTLRVRLVRQDGSTLAESLTGLEQAVLPVDMSAPYRVVFAAEWREYATVVVELVSADAATRAEHLVPVQIAAPLLTRLNGLYRYSATVRNIFDEPVYARRAVLMLYDPKGKLVGYRVLAMERELLPGDELAIAITLMPVVDTPVTPLLLVEAAER